MKAFLLLVSSLTVALGSLSLQLSSQLLQDAVNRELLSIETLLIDTITAKKYNKNLDIDYSTLRFEEGADESSFGVSVDVSMRKGPGQIMGTFTLVLTNKIVPDEEAFKVTR